MKKIKKLSLKKEVIASLSQKEQNDALGGVVASVGCDSQNAGCVIKTVDATDCTRCYYCPIDPITIVVIPTTTPINSVVCVPYSTNC